MNKTLLTVAIAAASMMVGCRSGNTESVGVVSELPANTLRMQWSRQLTTAGTPRDMYVRNDSLFVYSTENEMIRFDRKSGDVTFISDVAASGAKVGAPALVGDKLAIPIDTRIRIIDSRGFLDHDIELGSPIRSGIVADESGIYCGIDAGTSGGRIAAIDLDRPFSPYRWQLVTGGTVIATPAMIDENLYAASSDGLVYAVDPDRGALWESIGGTFRTSGPVRTDVKADEEGVYVASADSKLYCLDPATGRIKWQYFAGMPLFDSPALSTGSVYILVRDRGVCCLSKGDGAYNRQPKWTVENTVQFLAEDDKIAYLRGKNDQIIGVDKETGELKVRGELRGLAAFAVNEIDGLVYAATKGGKVFAATAVTKPGEVGEIVMIELPEASVQN